MSNTFHLNAMTFQAPELAPGLYLVATPIGNLRDITLRALETLAAVDLIYCEDTRQSRKLIDRYGMHARFRVYNDHSDEVGRQDVIASLQEGKSVALISDAGLPVISDPGYKLVSAVREQDIQIVVIPGASAAVTALAGSGLPPQPHLFVGFLAQKQGRRRSAIEALKSIEATLIFYEAPHRLAHALADMLEIFGDRPAVVARELTKQYEEYKAGTLLSLTVHYTETQVKGECVILVGPPLPISWDEEAIEAEIQKMLQSHSVKQAAELVSKTTGATKRDIYQRALALKNG